jgi:hypothetical protein
MNRTSRVFVALAVIACGGWSGTAAAITCADLEGASVVSQEPSPVYLGFFGSQYATDSVDNLYGTYGSQYSNLSVRNSYGAYGSSYGTYSAFNPYTSTPPAIFKRGEIIGFLTTNTVISLGVSLAAIDANCTFFSSVPTPQYPEVPLGALASDGFVGAIELIWLSARGASWYEIYRGTSSSFANSSYIGFTYSESALDTQVAFQQTYYYWIVACNDFGCSLPSLPDAGYAVAQAPNAPPVAAAGSDISVFDNDWDGSEAVQLNGTGSGDSDGSIVGYEWFKGADKIAEGAAPVVSLPIGAHDVVLRVTDDDGATGEDSIRVTVSTPAIDPPPIATVIESGRVAGNETWAAIRREPDNPRHFVYVHRASDSVQLATLDLGLEFLVDMIPLRHENTATDATLAALVIDGPGAAKVRTYRISDGALVRTNSILNEDWQVLDLVELPDMNGDERSDYAVLGRNVATGENAAQVRSGSDGAFIKNVFFLNSGWQPVHLVALPNFSGSAAPELGLLATNAEGQIIVTVKDAGTNAFIRNVFFLNANWSVLGAGSVPDFADSAAGELVLAASNKSSGQLVMMLKDGGTNTFLNNVFPLGSNWQMRAGLLIPDETGNDVAEVAVLGTNNDSGKIVIQVRDTGSGSFLRNLSVLGSNWTPNNFVGFGTATAERFVVVARRTSDQLEVVQTIDATSGEVLSNVFLKPAVQAAASSVVLGEYELDSTIRAHGSLPTL